jgi:homocysteine S-methyltransferase
MPTNPSGDPIARLLAQKPVIILDGALATELERSGADLDDPLWSARVLIEAPETIRAVHLDYFRAGADCAITASYQASYEGFARRGYTAEQSTGLIQASVQLALEARAQYLAETAGLGRPQPLVAASVGPYGAFLADGSEYRGDYDLDLAGLMEFHRPRMAALLAAGPDLLACETIPCLLEARALVSLLSEFPAARAWFSFSARDEAHTCHGETMAECAAVLEACPQVLAIGINCSAPKYIPGLVANLRAATSKPILVYPNSGEIYNPANNSWTGETDCAAFGEQAKDWYQAGARLLGGCCRTTPDHIRAISAWAQTLPAR